MSKGEQKELKKLVEHWENAKRLAETARNSAGYDDARVFQAEIDTYTACIEGLNKRLREFNVS
jgi:hypothetical protein